MSTINPAHEVLACNGDGGTLLIAAGIADFPYIDSLRKSEGGALGFIPKERYVSLLEKRPDKGRPGRNDHLYERLVITADNDDRTGFAYIRFSPTRGAAVIWQIAVQEDARRWQRALLITEWVETEALSYGCSRVTARVAADIESNLFWRAAGYEVYGENRSTFLFRKPSKSGRLLLQYVKHLSVPWQGALPLEPA